MHTQPHSRTHNTSKRCLWSEKISIQFFFAVFFMLQKFNDLKAALWVAYYFFMLLQYRKKSSLDNCELLGMRLVVLEDDSGDQVMRDHLRVAHLSI